jgi:hypothetical protein
MADEWRRIAEWDWVWYGSHDTARPARDLLHAVATITNDPDEEWFGRGTTECGLEGDLSIPGIFSRMSATRCPDCCRIVGMPEGEQSPKNIDECRPIVEARIAAL